MRIEHAPGTTGPTWAMNEKGSGAAGDPIEVTPALTILDGPRLGECYRLADEQRTAVIGRGTSAHFVVPHPTVSKVHARVFVAHEMAGQRVKIVDMGSRNGTYLNGERVDEAYLEPGDKIHLGEVLLRFDLVDPVDARFLDTVAVRVAQAERDGLTGLWRRSVLPREGAALLARCQARGESLAVLMIDLDHFKRLNDTYGHPAGDDALRIAARAVMASVRQGDLAVRYGGEELAVVLPGASIEEAGAIACRIGLALAAAPIAGVPETYRVTASQGLALARFGEALDDVVSRADVALLRAKRLGRNRLEIA